MKFLRVSLLVLVAVSVHAQVVVNEIMYNSASHDPREEWVELLNTSSTNVNLSGWTISGGIDFKFPNNTIVGPGRYLVVAAHQPTFAARFPTVTNVVGSWLTISVVGVNGRGLTNFNPVLSNTRNSINLNNSVGDRVDSVTYADAGDWAVRRLEPPNGSAPRGWGWYTGADGGGCSLELRNPSLPNQYGQNWLQSPTNNPTPGRVNAANTNNIPPMVVEVAHAPIVPRSTDQITITARVIDEAPASLTVNLFYRVDSGSPPPFSSVQMFDDGNHHDASANDGIYGITLSPMTNNILVEYYVEATDAGGRVRSWPGLSADALTPHSANAMFQVDDVTYTGVPPTYKLIMTTAQQNDLGTLFNQFAQSDNEVNATFISIDATGVDLHHLCGVRNRGHGSRTANPHNYRINFPDDDPWKDLTGFNINAQVISAQVVGAAIAQKAGLAGNRSRFVQLRVNNGAGPGGTPASGLYAGNEDISGTWAERQFPNDSGGNSYAVYRDITPPNFNYRGEDANSYRNTYFKQSNVAEDDWQDIIGMLYVMGENQTNLFDIDAARTVMNVEQWLLHLAVMNIFGNNETGLNTGYNDDYDLYRGISDPRFVLIYHDLDTILGLGGAIAANNQNLFTAAGPMGGEGSWRAMNFFMHNPDVEPIYYRTLQMLMDTVFSQAQFDFTVDSVVADFPQVTGDANTMKNYMNTRRTTVQNALIGHVPVPVDYPTAVITGEPRSPTWRTTATITVGGPTVAMYQWRLNNGPWNPATPVSTPITLSGLPSGSTNTVYVQARSSNSVWQIGSTVSRTWVVNPATPTVQLNEVLARNDSGPDMIELYNDGSGPVSLAGMRLTDDLSDSVRYVFPPGSSLAAGTYLVLSQNDLGFGLDSGGESLFLLAATGTNVLDSITFGPQLSNLSVGRVGTGGTWFLGQPSFGGANNVLATGSSGTALRINEWLAFGSPSNPDDLIELYNPDTLPLDLAGYYLTDNPIGLPARHRMRDLSFIPAHGYLVLTADGNTNNGDHVNFQLDAEQGEIALFSPQYAQIDYIVYGPQRQGVAMGRCPDGANSIRQLTIPTFGFGNFCPAPPPPPQLINIMPFTNVWRYHQFTNLDGVSWQVPAFNDSSWSNGVGVFGVTSGGTPEPVRTTLTTGGNRITYYFRSTFTFPSNLFATSLQFSNIIDDGAVFYINGAEVGRYNLPTGQITYGTLATTVGGAPGWTRMVVPLNSVQPGLNTIAVEVHQNTTSSPDIFFGSRFDALIVTNDPGAAGIVMNEIFANNGSLTNLDGSTPDFVELYNPSSLAVDIAGMSFTDDPLDPQKWVAPPGTIVPASAYLVIEFDADKPPSPVNTGFGLSSDGDQLFLLNAQLDVVDFIEFGMQPEDYSLGRVPNGSTNWVLTLPTIGSGNAASPLGDFRKVKINEWMPAPASGDDWFELYNPETLPIRLSGCYLSDVVEEPTKYLPMANHSYMGAGTNAWKKIVADSNVGAGANHAPFRLNNTVEAVVISDPNGGAIHSITYNYPVAQIGVSEGFLPDGSGTRVFFPTTASPNEANYLPLADLVINEVLTHTDLPLEDAVELYNRGSSSVNIGGWWLSDSRRQLRKYQLPLNTTVPARGYIVLYEYRFNDRDLAAEPFALSSTGDEVFLSQIVSGSGALTGYRAGADFGAAANGVSFGRYENTEGRIDYPALTRRTFGRDSALTVQDFRNGTGASNAYPIIGPIVITEIMYHPPDIGSSQDNIGHEFIELYNLTASPVALYDPAHPTNTWHLRDAVDFDFPQNTVIPPGGYILVVSFDPTNSVALDSFHAQYGTNSVLYGPYSGKLDNSDDSVELRRPDAPNNGKAPYILVDKVRYSDHAPWDPAADGTGQSLQRRSFYAYGNEATNWVAAIPSPGPSASADTDDDGMPDSWELANGFDPNSAADAALDFDGDGFTNLQEYIAGTDPRSAQSYLRLGLISRGPGEILIDFQAAAGVTYSVQYRTLVHTGDWTKLVDVPAQSTAQWIRVFDPAPAAATRFYRLVAPSTP